MTNFRLFYSQKWIGNWNAKLKKKRAGCVSGEGPLPKKTVRERKVTAQNVFYGKLAREGSVHRTLIFLIGQTLYFD